MPARSDTATETYYARFARRSMLSEGVAYRIQLPNQEPAEARATFRSDTLFIAVGGDSVWVDMRPAIAGASVVRQRAGAPVNDVDALPVTDRTGAKRGDLLVLDMTVSQEKRVRSMAHLDAILLLR